MQNNQKERGVKHIIEPVFHLLQGLPEDQISRIESMFSEYCENHYLLNGFNEWMAETGDMSNESLTNKRYLEEKEQRLMGAQIVVLKNAGVLKDKVAENNRQLFANILDQVYIIYEQDKRNIDDPVVDSNILRNEHIPQSGHVPIRPSMAPGQIPVQPKKRFNRP